MLRCGPVVVLAWLLLHGRAMETCPGTIEFDGYGPVEITVTAVNTDQGDDAATVNVEDGKVMPDYNGRSYFADTCHSGQFDHKAYLALPLLNKAITFTTDMSGLGCGCNAAFYLTNMHQNSKISKCGDYYCDANSVCGVACHEIDIMEGNAHAFHYTLHSEDDRFGVGGGYGGGSPHWSGPREWTKQQYGPGGECINTSEPFQVTAAFPMDSWGMLKAMVITLSQAGKPCNLTGSVTHYDGNTTNSAKGSNAGMAALTGSLKAGVTPIVSFWGHDDMTWMDGVGKDGLGPCAKDTEVNCPNSTTMRDFMLTELPPPEPLWHLFLWHIIGAGALLAVGAVTGIYFFMGKSGEPSQAILQQPLSAGVE